MIRSVSRKHRRLTEDRRADELNECQRTEIKTAWHPVGTWKTLLNKNHKESEYKEGCSNRPTSKGRELHFTGGVQAEFLSK